MLASRQDAFADVNHQSGTAVHGRLTCESVAPGCPLDNEYAARNVGTSTFCGRCGSYMGWKQISLGGRRASKSFSDFKSIGWRDSLRRDLELDRKTRGVRPAKQEVFRPRSSAALLDVLPFEVLTQIVELLFVDTPSDGYGPRNADLVSCLLACKKLHAAALSVLYKHISISHSKIFSKFLHQVSCHPVLGSLVRRLDFSCFSSIGLGRTRKMNTEIQMLTARSLLQCLQLTPRLREFLLQEHVDSDLDRAVLEQIFTGLPHLKGLDCCGCSSPEFQDAILHLTSPINLALPLVLPLQRLSLHECNTLPTDVFDVLLPRLPHLTHLDLARTQISDEGLWSISETARLTHLNLARCTKVSGEGVVKFLTMHASVRSSLVYLNLLADISRYRLLWAPLISELLPQLPNTLRSLNLNGAQLRPDHLPLLLPLTKHLEELGIASSEFSMRDINHLFVPNVPNACSDDNMTVEEATWVPSALHYLDLTGIRGITASGLVSNSLLLTAAAEPLEVIELGEKVLKDFKDRPATGRRLGWDVKELGRRGWYVRTARAHKDGSDGDDGSREWKWGVKWWGMRKLPVAGGPAAGLYIHYMFKL